MLNEIFQKMKILSFKITNNLSVWRPWQYLIDVFSRDVDRESWRREEIYENLVESFANIWWKICKSNDISFGLCESCALNISEFLKNLEDISMETSNF